MAEEIFQGDWDELVRRLDLRGRKVRVIVMDQSTSNHSWIQSLRAWAGGHKPLGGDVDVSREGIYSGTMDDPR